MRLGRVEFNIGYVIDLDNENMVDHAKEAIQEDIESAIRNGVSINIVTDYDGITEGDIPEFLLDEDEECLVDSDGCLIDNDGDAETDMEAIRRDEKNGLYPDKWDIAN